MFPVRVWAAVLGAAPFDHKVLMAGPRDAVLPAEVEPRPGPIVPRHPQPPRGLVEFVRRYGVGGNLRTSLGDVGS